MIREVDLVSYLPPFIAEYKEINNALAAENPEFQLIWEAADRALRNEFIETADEYGISRFEKMMGLFPSKDDSLESRRLNIRSKWFTMLPYTWRMLMDRLLLLCGEEPFIVDTSRLKVYELRIEIFNQTIATLRAIRKMAGEMIPANILLFLSGRYPFQYQVPVNWDNIFRFRAEFFPRYNLAYLRLDGSWKLDGTRRLNGYDSASSLDFYPVKIRTGTGASEDVQTAGQLCFASRAEPDIKTETSLRIQAETSTGPDTGERLKVGSTVGTDVSSGSGLHLIQTARADAATGSGVQLQTEAAEKMQAKQQLRVQLSAGISVETHSYMTKLNRLDGTWKLDGSRKLDGGRYIL